MKIAFLLGSINGNGGIARSTSIVAKYLSEDTSNEVSVISYCNAKTDISRGKTTGIQYMTIFDKQVNLKKGFFSARKKIRAFLKKNEIDILVSCGALYFILGAVSAKGLKTKSVAWEHSNLTSNTGHIGKKYTRKIGAKISDYVVTLTKKDQENYLKYIRKDNVKYIYNPIDPLLLSNKAIYKADAKKIITVGNLNPFKNYTDLLKVAKEIFTEDRFSDWQWDIYGEGPERPVIEETIKEYGLTDKVVLKGHTTNIYEILNNYSIYVCTSKSEGLPMSLIEAKAKKLPIVSFDIMTGPSEIISDGQNGYLVEPYNIEEMVRKLEILMESAEKREQFSNNAYIGIEQFSIEECIHQWNMVFQKL
ncbi:MAG: glycosyltransferase family 4 protein [Christensenellaceae bacterium]